MASPAKLKELEAKRLRATGQTEKPEAKTDEKPERDLNDITVQEEILNPKPAPITIGGREYIVYPLSAKRAREFIGFVQQVFAETFSGKTEVSDGSSVLSRTVGILTERFTGRFARYVAYATGEPGQVEYSQAEQLGAEFDDKLTNGEISLAYVVLCNQNNVLQTLFPKVNAEPKK